MFKPMVVDLSHHNNVTSYTEMMNSGIVGLIHKATQGTKYVDPRYEYRKPRAIKAGLLFGAYHFADGSDVKDQVSHFLDTVGDTKDQLLCLDFEPNPNGSSMSIRQARDWLDLVRDRTGQKALFYSGHYVKELLGTKKDELLGKHRLWLAQYGPKLKLPTTWNECWLWQYAADGIGPQPRKISGVDGTPDLNVFCKNDPDLLRKEWIQ